MVKESTCHDPFPLCISLKLLHFCVKVKMVILNPMEKQICSQYWHVYSSGLDNYTSDAF